MDQEKQLLDEPIEDAESEMNEDEKREKGDWHQQLFKACQRGDLEHVEKCISKKANVHTEDKKKWNPLMWAACKGYVEIVRVLISRGAAIPYQVDYTGQDTVNFSSTAPLYQSPTLQQSPTMYQNQSTLVSGQSPISKDAQATIITKKVIQGFINQQVRPTPLQWACFKGHLQIVWLLLKNGLSWEDVDQFGNNSVHLASSGGNIQVFQTLLYFGVATDRQNTRGHTAKDLATNLNIIMLIKQLEAGNTKEKYFCMSCRNFFKLENYVLKWTFEKAESLDEEKPEGRCNQCWEIIKINTTELVDLIDQQQYQPLTAKINEIQTHGIEIDPKTMKKALYEQEKLRTQNAILDYISTLNYVENYKTILKSVNQIKGMLDDAVQREIIIDDSVKDKAANEMDRLVAERNLQFQLDNLDVGQSTQEQVVELNDKVQSATEKGVAKEYIDQASELRDKMAKAIQAKKILRMFNEYPIREIPDPIKWDPKTKKPIDPITQKPMDPLKLALQQQKKKKKKEPKFIIPEWATDVKELDDNIKNLEGLLKEAEILNLNNQFIDESIQQIKRMKNEMRYRKEVDDQLKLIADAKAAEKKKNR